jgi:hypothetical protein
MTRRRRAVTIVLGAAACALSVRGWGYYWGSGPHDGEDLRAFATFLEAAALLFAAALAWWGARPRRRAVSLLSIGLPGLLLLSTFAWYVLNVRLERWAR